MPKLDAAMVQKIYSDLSKLSEDTKPQWGKMNVAQMRGHMMMAVQYSLGVGNEMPFKGNWKSRNIFKPLILSGLVAIPKGVKLPKQKDGTDAPMPLTSLEELKATLDEFVAKASAGQSPTRMHPFFGPLAPGEWQKFHVAHFKHHLTQFGVWS